MNEHTRLAIASGLFAGTALAAVAGGWLLAAIATPAKPAAVSPPFDHRRFNESVTAAEQSRRLQNMRPCCAPGETMPTPEERAAAALRMQQWKRQHDEDLKRLKARPLDPTGNRVAPRPRWEWKQT